MEMVGVQYGRLTVVRISSEKSKDGRIQCECRCSCGGSVIATAKNLRASNTRSCGCIRKENGHKSAKDMTGMRFGKLQVLRHAGTSKQRTAMWWCRCDCGNECVVSGSYLRTGDTKSCGCLQKELTQRRFTKDLTNQRFGKLVAVRPTDSRERKRGVEWLCLCECGNYCTVVCEDLCSGATKSCGC